MPSAYELQMRGYRLTTANIFYYLPDRPRLLAPPFIWQKLDLAPDFPVIQGFLEWWSRALEGKLNSVDIKQSGKLIVPNWRSAQFDGLLH